MTDAVKEDGSPALQATANQIDVRVFAIPVDNTVVFTHDWRANGGQYSDPPIEVPHGQRDWQLTYTLHDFTQESLRFAQNNQQNAEDAMWVRQGKGCPVGKGSGNNQIGFGPCAPTSFTVLDYNDGAPCTLTYMLRFENNDNPPRMYRYDPEIKNGGTN